MIESGLWLVVAVSAGAALLVLWIARERWIHRRRRRAGREPGR
jgi:hypothetical protein